MELEGGTYYPQADLTLEEAREMLIVDKHNLDFELEIQGDVFFRISEKLSDARSVAADMKDRLNREESRLDLETRELLDKEIKKGDRSKYSEANVKNLVLTSKDREKAYNAYIRAETEAAAWANLKEAFSKRTSGVNDLCSLYHDNYWTRNSAKAKNQQVAAIKAVRERLRLNKEKDRD